MNMTTEGKTPRTTFLLENGDGKLRWLQEQWLALSLVKLFSYVWHFDPVFVSLLFGIGTVATRAMENENLFIQFLSPKFFLWKIQIIIFVIKQNLCEKKSFC